MKKKIIIGLSCMALSAVGVVACGTSTGGDTNSTTVAQDTTTEVSTTAQVETTTVQDEQGQDYNECKPCRGAFFLTETALCYMAYAVFFNG